MTRKAALILVACLCAVVAKPAFAQQQLRLTVNTGSPGPAVPIDFSGLGFERGTESSGNAGVSGYFFSPQNTQLVTLFQNLSIKSLRIGGGSVDDEIPAGTGSDGYTGVDGVFSFAQATGVKVLYSLRLLNAVSDAIPNLQADDVAIAQHIVQSDPPFLDSFEIGNEPDFHSYHGYCTATGCTCAYPTGCTGTSSNLHIEDPLIYETVPIGSTTTAGTAFPSYLADWRGYENAIAAGLPSGAAKFSAPDTGAYSTLTDYNGISWTQLMAEDEKSTGIFADATQHYYVGGSPGATIATQAIDDMLSPEWVTGTQIATGPEGPPTYTPYLWLYTNNLAPVSADGLPYRLTESDDFVTGVNGASNAFASALWALDYMHWWAEHGATGVNLHNKQWIYTDTIVPDPNPCVTTCGNYQAAPKGYGIKAFDLGGHGYAEPVSMTNPGAVNVTAYAVGDASDLYLTIINKTHATTNDAATVDVTIQPQGFPTASASSMTLDDWKFSESGGLGRQIGYGLGQNRNGAGVWSVTQQVPGGEWGNWTTLGGYPIGSSLVVSSTADGRIQLFGAGKNGDIWSAWQTAANGSWTDWTEFEGKGLRLSSGRPQASPYESIFPIGVDRSWALYAAFYQEKLHIAALGRNTVIGKML